ncbi:MAG: hypothetical protein ACIARQ_15700 [Phycisphaerales bacterium JB061]
MPRISIGHNLCSGLALGALVHCGVARAQDTLGNDPLKTDRVVALYNFEEPDNPFDLPGSFYRAQSDPTAGIERPGYPVFNQAAFDYDVRHTGEASVRLPIKRGSVALRLRPGALPVFLEADYRVSCYVRGEGLQHARFRLVVRYLDASGNAIEGSELYTDPILPQAQWERVELVVPGGRTPGAAFLQIDTEVVQPELIGQAELGEHQIWPEDYSGQAWVDDILVEQLPRLVLSTQARSNIVMAPESPRLNLLVRDLTGLELNARLTVRDHLGQVIDVQSRRVESSRIPSVWEPELRGFGWYSAEIELISSGQVISVVPVEFCWVPGLDEETTLDSAVTISRSRFGMSAERYEPQLIEMLDELAHRLAAETLVLGVWSDETDESEANSQALRLGALSNTTGSAWSRLIISLPKVPVSIRKLLQTDTGEVLRVLATTDAEEPERIENLLEPLLDRLGQFVRRWRIGSLEDDGIFWDADLGQRIDRARGVLSMLVPGPIVDVPWASDLDFAPLLDASNLGAVTVHLPAGSGIHAVTDVLQRWAESGLDQTSRLTLAIGTGGSADFGPAQACAELVKRLVLVEAAVADLDLKPAPDVELIKPWKWSEDLDPVLHPMPEAAAWRATIDRLRGRRVSANLAFQPGTHVYLLTPVDTESDRGGALVAWNETAPLDEAVVNIFLGEDDVTVIDMWGNQSGTISPTRIDMGEGKGIDIHEIPISTEPVFIEGIDVNLALFTSSIRLDEPMIESVPGPHNRMISLTNPWTVAIDGSLIVTEPSPRLSSGRPSGWDISPRVVRFSAGPGESIEIPIAIEFSPVEQTGQKQLVVDVLLSAGPVAERIRAASKFEVSLPGIELDVRSLVSPNGQDVAVEAVVTNTTLDPVDLDLGASARGYARQGAPISQLAPGAAVVRRFVYPDGVNKLKGHHVYVSVDHLARNGKINKRIMID